MSLSSTNRGRLSDINATGLGAQDLSSKRGGNDTRSAADTFRPTGIVATGSPQSDARDLYSRFTETKRPAFAKQRNM